MKCFRKLKNQTREAVTELDAFGYSMAVLFDKEKDSDAYYPTFLGGAVTLLVYICMSVFILVQYLKIKDGALERYSVVR
jgi:hypothetical protein